MTVKEKKCLLARAIELKVQLGEDITGFITHPLSYYDWDRMPKFVEIKQKQYDEQ